MRYHKKAKANAYLIIVYIQSVVMVYMSDNLDQVIQSHNDVQKTSWSECAVVLKLSKIEYKIINLSQLQPHTKRVSRLTCATAISAEHSANDNLLLPTLEASRPWFMRAVAKLGANNCFCCLQRVSNYL